MNLAEGLKEELERNRTLLKLYQGIPGGWFGVGIIKNKIKQAEDAMADGDVVAMLRTYEDLKATE